MCARGGVHVGYAAFMHWIHIFVSEHEWVVGSVVSVFTHTYKYMFFLPAVINSLDFGYFGAFGGHSRSFPVRVISFNRRQWLNQHTRFEVPCPECPTGQDRSKVKGKVNLHQIIQS